MQDDANIPTLPIIRTSSQPPVCPRITEAFQHPVSNTTAAMSNKQTTVRRAVRQRFGSVLMTVFPHFTETMCEMRQRALLILASTSTNSYTLVVAIA